MSVINEEWRSIDGYINYQVSNIGRVRNANTGRMLKQSLNNNGYYYGGLTKEAKQQQHLVHRLVANEFLEKPDNNYKYDIDHIDRDRTNNKMCNIRLATRSENMMNQTKSNTRQTSSQYKGVYKAGNNWRAAVRCQGKKYDLGYFNSEERAARAYNEKAIELGGEYANINFI